MAQISGYKVTRAALGHLRIDPIPSKEELAAYYNDKYFAASDGRNPYAHQYTADELYHKTIAAQETLRIVPGPGRAFEVGVGEGFMLAELRKAGWEVAGIDFTADGLKAYNPDLLPLVGLGDAYALLDEAIAAGARYDLLVCNHVLEHVGDPEGLLTRMLRLLEPGGTCRIVVPNDGSWLHQLLERDGDAPEHFYLAPPDHLQYFTREPLVRMMEQCGYRVTDLLGEFPIDMFLLHPGSNYVKDRSLGRAAHFARIRFETALARRSLDELIAFRRGCAAAGVGRTIVAYAQPA